jgi:hypothetical protein
MYECFHISECLAQTGTYLVLRTKARSDQDTTSRCHQNRGSRDICDPDLASLAYQQHAIPSDMRGISL